MRDPQATLRRSGISWWDTNRPLDSRICENAKNAVGGTRPSFVNGEDTTEMPLEARRAQLAQVVEKTGLLLSLQLPGSVQDIVRTVRAMQLDVSSPSARTLNMRPVNDPAPGRS